jgi:hypothetical protein
VLNAAWMWAQHQRQQQVQVWAAAQLQVWWAFWTHWSAQQPRLEAWRQSCSGI